MRRLSVIVVSDTDIAGTLTRAGVRAHDCPRGAQRHPPNEDEIDLIRSASMNPGRSLTDIGMRVGKGGQWDHHRRGKWLLLYGEVCLGVGIAGSASGRLGRAGVADGAWRRAGA